MALVCFWVLCCFLSGSQDTVDYKMVAKIREEGFSRSQVMEIAWDSSEWGCRVFNSCKMTWSSLRPLFTRTWMCMTGW